MTDIEELTLDILNDDRLYESDFNANRDPVHFIMRTYGLNRETARRVVKTADEMFRNLLQI